MSANLFQLGEKISIFKEGCVSNSIYMPSLPRQDDKGNKRVSTSDT